MTSGYTAADYGKMVKYMLVNNNITNLTLTFNRVFANPTDSSYALSSLKDAAPMDDLYEDLRSMGDFKGFALSREQFNKEILQAFVVAGGRPYMLKTQGGRRRPRGKQSRRKQRKQRRQSRRN